MSKKIKVEKSVLDWCNEQVDAGKELTIHWDGGGDSGWAYFQIDGEEVNNDFTNYLVDQMYAELDYGSWAGEFSACGEARYDKEEEAFVGTDNYTETESYVHKCKIKVKVPNTLWYDRIAIRLEGEECEGNLDVETRFVLNNGFLTPEHDKCAEKISEMLTPLVNDEIEKFSENHNYRSIWETIEFGSSEGSVGKKDTTFTISSLDIQAEQTDEKDIYLQISPFAKF